MSGRDAASALRMGRLSWRGRSGLPGDAGRTRPAEVDAPTVLHVIAGLGVGGAERTLASLLTAERARPHLQAVVDLHPGGELAPALRDAGVTVHEIGLSRPLAVGRVVSRLARLLGELRPSVVQTWMYYADLVGLWALERSGRRGATHLYWGVRCSDVSVSRYRLSLRWTVSACARRAHRADAVVANSHAGRDHHLRIGYTPRAFAVIPNGIDTVRFHPDPEARERVRKELGVDRSAFVAVHPARIDPMKDHATMLAAALLRPDVLVLAVGKGTERLRGAANVRGLGVRRDMPGLYAAADVVLSTSSFGEGFSNALAEGMAAGLPAVGTDVGDARRIVGPAGTVVAPRDPAALAAALGWLCGSDAGTRARLGAAARTRIESHFSLGRAVTSFDALHREGTIPGDGWSE